MHLGAWPSVRVGRRIASATLLHYADRVGRELELLFQTSAYQAEDDLVFGHRHTGHTLERSDASVAAGAKVPHTVTFKVAANAHGSTLIPVAAASSLAKLEN